MLYALPAGPAKFGAPGGIAVSDSNAMSVIDVVDTTTGNIVETIGDFNSPSVNGYPFATNPGIQLWLAASGARAARGIVDGTSPGCLHKSAP